MGLGNGSLGGRLGKGGLGKGGLGKDGLWKRDWEGAGKGDWEGVGEGGCGDGLGTSLEEIYTHMFPSSSSGFYVRERRAALAPRRTILSLPLPWSQRPRHIWTLIPLLLPIALLLVLRHRSLVLLVPVMVPLHVSPSWYLHRHASWRRPARIREVWPRRTRRPHGAAALVRWQNGRRGRVELYAVAHGALGEGMGGK